MQHFTNFGYIKTANKQLRNLYETQPLYSSKKSLGDTAANLVGASNVRVGIEKRSLDERKRGRRFNRARQKDELSLPYQKEIGYETKPTKDFTDIRRTLDTAASPTGYLGYRTDPFKGYGGMMEEPIPPQDLLNMKKKEVLQAYNTGNGFIIPRDYSY
jgi:hypothetical protein